MKVKKVLRVKPKAKAKKVKVKSKAKPAKKKVSKKPVVKEKKTEKSKPEKIKKQKAAKKKTSPPKVEERSPVDSLFKAKIKVIGVGGGGGSIVSEIGRSLEKATFVIADTDARALRNRPGIKYVLFGEELTHGLGTGVNVDLAMRAAESAKEKIGGIVKGQDILIFVACLGGGLGSGATQVFAQIAKEFDGIIFGIFTLPFKFEGKNKYNIAQTALKSLKQFCNVSLVIPNERIFKTIDANTPLTSAFSVINKSLIESLESLIDLIYSPGVINIDFADLRAILRGVGNTAFLNTSEASGKTRAEKITESILKNPLLQQNNSKGEKILFNISSDDHLSMLEVEKISRHIAEANPEAKIIFGISRNSKLKNKIKTTILMTGGGRPEPARKVVESKKEPEEKVELKVPVAKKKPTLVKSSSEAKKENKQKPKNKKPESKPKSKKPRKEEVPSLSIPVFKTPVPMATVADIPIVLNKEEKVMKSGAIRRSGLQIKEAEEKEEKKRIDQEKEWEIPAFLRRVKFNK